MPFTPSNKAGRVSAEARKIELEIMEKASLRIEEENEKIIKVGVHPDLIESLGHEVAKYRFIKKNDKKIYITDSFFLNGNEFFKNMGDEMLNILWYGRASETSFALGSREFFLNNFK